MPVITISRQTGSLGETLALDLSRTLGLPLIDREYVQTRWLSKIAKSRELYVLKNSTKAHLAVSTEGIPFYMSIENHLKETALQTGAIILGLGSQIIFQDWPKSFHIRVTSPEPVRIDRICRQYGTDALQALKMIQLSDRKHRKYLWEIYHRNWEDPHLYDVILNTAKLPLPEAVAMIATLFPEHTAKTTALPQKSAETDKQQKSGFMHSSEEDFAKILDMYHVEWQYEPTTFPIKWDAEGNVIMAFTPDFYLPAFETYIELTTMQQKYVTAKNNKVRKLKSLYPAVNITILYKKDIHALLKKFGIQKEV